MEEINENKSIVRYKKVRFLDDHEPNTQSVWGETIPQELLYYIFQKVVANDGAIPAIIRLGRVCKLWNKVSLTLSLWRNINLSIWIKDMHKNELTLKWLIENRFAYCTDLNLDGWNLKNGLSILQCLAESSPNLNGLSLACWKHLSSDHLIYIADQFRELKRIDLTAVNTKVVTKKSAISLISLSNLIQQMNIRLTHLVLGQNYLTGLPQIITTLATHCPNLLTLDLSNVSIMAILHRLLDIEKLQFGCPKLKVLRITNSRITLTTVTTEDQMSSPGFPDLEELSVASMSEESQFIDDEYIQRILKTSKKLKVLDVRYCKLLTHDGLIRLPAENLKRLFLSGSSITRTLGPGLELIALKWAHSLTEIDLAWSKEQLSLDSSLRTLAEKGDESHLSHIDLSGSSVSLVAAKEVLARCPVINSINLSSCRSLPRGVKRLFNGDSEITQLKENLGVYEIKRKSRR